MGVQPHQVRSPVSVVAGAAAAAEAAAGEAAGAVAAAGVGVLLLEQALKANSATVARCRHAAVRPSLPTSPFSVSRSFPPDLGLWRRIPSRCGRRSPSSGRGVRRYVGERCEAWMSWPTTCQRFRRRTCHAVAAPRKRSRNLRCDVTLYSRKGSSMAVRRDGGLERWMAGKGVTIAQIAAEAGVSVPTISRVLNGRSGVSTEKRELVERLLVEHGYQRRNRQDRAGLIYFVITDLETQWATTLLRGAEAEAGRLGFRPGRQDDPRKPGGYARTGSSTSSSVGPPASSSSYRSSWTLAVRSSRASTCRSCWWTQ